MTHETLLLIGPGTEGRRAVVETHARRLRERGVVDAVRVATYEHEPERELADDLADLSGTVYALPTTVAHTRDTTGAIPALLSGLDAAVTYCAPLGDAPGVTSVLRERAEAVGPLDGDTSIALVGLGSSSLPHQRQTVEYHAERLRGRTPVQSVHACYLVQNPAVECARYNLDGARAVAIPFFLAPCDATEQTVPEKLELGRGGLAYAEPLGEHPRLTDAIERTVETKRALADSSPTFESTLTADSQALATDGDGR
ncbi:MAG: CbiX/SirB N-terminal domain-containing protein [Haloarculaceae archaeon]